MMARRRALNGTGFSVCVALLAYAFYVQFQLHLEPCPLCIFQRVGIAAVGLLFLLAAVHHPAAVGARVYGVLIDLAAMATLAIALRHVYIQHLPEGSVPICGASLDFMWKIFSPAEVIRKVLTGSGECAKVTWTFLALSMPTWVAIASVALGSVGLLANFSKERS
jgi:protein dithiol:quinone oxidoreductase